MRGWTLTLLVACSGGGEGSPSDTGASPTTSGTDTETSEPTDTTDTTDTPTDTGATTTPTTTTPTDDSIQQLCVDTINDYRATLGLQPYARWDTAEACADTQAQDDSQTGIPHGAFGQCGEFAQNECPGWRGSLEQVLDSCLAMMWAEGPGADFYEHGHYINMSSTQYSEVACGFYVTPGGEVWAVQDFR